VRRRRTEGFTLIEVMVSLGVMTIGAMAIMALLAHIIRSNAHARQMNTAMNIGQAWVERMKQDAHTWTQIGLATGTPSAADVLASTLYLRNVTSTPDPAFRVIPASTATVSAAFDYQGLDVALPVSGGATYHYCVAYRANWIYFGSTMRVDIRVFWPREGTGADIMSDWASCNGDHTRLDPGGGLLDRYHVLYVPTAIGVTPVPR
jgi:prepilin-type N-terminal cleavage/methylation domain-containing protein